jgi:ribonucleoside-diphosphate reductase alpha chain
MGAFPDIYEGGTIAINVLRERYLKKSEAGELVEAPKDMFERVARDIGQADAKYGEDPSKIIPVFYDLMARGDFEPNTPCLANAGWPESTGQYSACFVLDVPDTMEGIFATLRNMALIHRSGGGTGFSFSNIRPEGDFVRSTTGVASGPVSFMAAFNNTTEVVKQSGIRRGANMGILRVDHPDVLKFIHCKRQACEVCSEMGKKFCDHNIRNFNISVALTDAFMAAFAADTEYDLVNPRTKSATGKLRARDVWRQIVENAWFSGEPGAFFVDRVNQLDPLSDHLGLIEATNPCGEVPMRPNDACNLGSVNLKRFYVEKGGKGTIDFARLRTVVRYGVHFLDNVITQNTYPIPEIQDVVTKCRKVGLGVMGWADLLVELGVPYASDKAVALAEEVMKFINASAVEASEELAQKRGPFHYWKESKWAKRGDKPRRNSTVTVIAPTGSISIIAGCNFGIEPFTALSMTRNQAGLVQHDFNQAFVDVAKRDGWYSSAIMEQVRKTGSCQNVSGVPPDVQELFKISGEIDCAWHVEMQAAFQKHTEDAVSKTINLPKTATIADVEDAYTLAWQLGCKGITVYRDGSRSKQVISAGTAVSGIKAERRNLKSISKVNGVRKRPGDTMSVDTPYGAVHVTINRHPVDGEPFECFVELGKSGTETKALTEGLGRVMSLHLSSPSSDSPREVLLQIAEQLDGIGGGSQAGFGEDKVVSASDGVSRAIRYYLSENQESLVQAQKRLDICPKCGQATLDKGAGCDLCRACGYSSC